MAATLAVAALARWNLADLADWGIDESANLWMGTLLLDGGGTGLGLVSSRGVPNLAGAPLLAAPLSLLPDLLAVSRGLSLLHLLALACLGVALVGRTAALPIAAAALVFHPAALLASLSLWNQYLSLPLLACALALLLVVAGEAAAPVARAAAIVGLGALLVLGAAVHLAGFADLAVLVALLFAVLVARPLPVDGTALAGGTALVAIGTGLLYAPWLAAVARYSPIRTSLVCAGGAVMFAALVLLAAAAPQNPFTRGLKRLADSRLLAWAVPAVLAGCAWLASFTVFRGAQPARRLVDAGDPWGFALLAAGGVLAAGAIPAWSGTVAACLARDCRSVSCSAGVAPGGNTRRRSFSRAPPCWSSHGCCSSPGSSTRRAAPICCSRFSRRWPPPLSCSPPAAGERDFRPSPAAPPPGSSSSPSPSPGRPPGSGTATRSFSRRAKCARRSTGSPPGTVRPAAARPSTSATISGKAASGWASPAARAPPGTRSAAPSTGSS